MLYLGNSWVVMDPGWGRPGRRGYFELVVSDGREFDRHVLKII